MAILDLKSNLSGWRKPSTVQEQEKKKISSAAEKAVYSTSNELKAPTDIKINKVDNSTSIQVPGAKKIEYKYYSINSKRGRSLPAISTLFGDTILEKISNYKTQIPEEISKPSNFIKITPRRIQHISSIEIIKTILKEKLSLFVKKFPIDLSKLSLYKEQVPIDIIKLSLYKDQIPNIIDKLSLYKDQLPKVLDKLSLYKEQLPRLLNKISLFNKRPFINGGLYDTREEIIKLLKYPYNKQIYSNKTLPAINAFDNLRSGAKGFTLNQKSSQFLGLDLSALVYTYPKTVNDGTLKDITKIVGANQWGRNVIFPNILNSTKYTRTVYSINNPYTTTVGITGDTLEKYFYRTNSPSARDILYTAFNLRDNSFNTGLTLFDQPLILSGIQRKGAKLNVFDTWKFDDGFIRGGVVTSTQRAIVDVLRIGKWYTSPKGLLFIARQVGLQGSAPNTEADPTLVGRIKNGAYSLASSLANVATQHLGLRFRKDAIPFVPRTTYSSVLTSPLYKNRLVMLKDAYAGLKFDPRLNNLLNGMGGAQSVYGIGTTNIRRSVNSFIPNYDDTSGKEYYTLGYKDIQTRIIELEKSPNSITNFLLNNLDGAPLNNDIANAKWIPTLGKFNEAATISNYAYTSQHQGPKLHVPDYGKRGKDLRNPLTGSFMSKYIPGTYGMTDPIWKINQIDKEAVDDFVKFMFHDLNTNERFRFRAYIESVSEDFNPNWQEVKILGRADSPYIYQGFERSVSISFKAAALSRGDLMLMWDQLERLAKTTVPKYSNEFKMKGPLIKFTLGNWFINTPAFIRSLSYTVDNETPWEINLGDSNIYGAGATENNVGELPMIVSVQVSLQIFGETRPETIKSVPTPKGITEKGHYSSGNLYPLGGRPAMEDSRTGIKVPSSDLRQERQNRL